MGSKHIVYICDPDKSKGKCKGYGYPNWCGSKCYSTLCLGRAKRDSNGRLMLNRKFMRDKRSEFRFEEKQRRMELKGLI